MEVKAKVLCENAVYGMGGIAEHGWAVWLETPAGNLLFDTGQGKALLPNATLFGIDLASTRAILISHHHYDHTGGLLDALRVISARREETGVPVHAHFDLFKDSYSMPKGKKPRYIGMPFSREALEGAGALFFLDSKWRQVGEGVFLTGEVPRETAFERGDPNLKHFDVDGKPVADSVRDDQTLVVATRQGLVVVLGCSHAGIVNILTYISARTGRSDFHTVIGGTHLGPAPAEQVEKTIEALLAFNIQHLGVSHCTGPGPAAQLAQAFGERFFHCNVGTEIEV
jgi:7,8-dihydropterin-6-yl-methyl-4-(beta-D-ribofuranosyl)aminobenzene 5'-phosphate synthase